MHIFFDVDGVLNKKSQWSRSYQLDYNCVKEFCELVKKLNATIVLSSTWRKGFLRAKSEQNYPHIKALEKALAKYGVQIAGKTPIIEGVAVRDKEILEYITKNMVEDYIVIDDDESEFSVFTNHNYFVDADTGFAEKDKKYLTKHRRAYKS